MSAFRLDCTGSTRRLTLLHFSVLRTYMKDNIVFYVKVLITKMNAISAKLRMIFNVLQNAGIIEEVEYLPSVQRYTHHRCICAIYFIRPEKT